MKLRQKIGVALAALWVLGAVGILIWMAQADLARLPTPALDILVQIYLAFTPLMVAMLAPGENRHFEPGENNQFQPGRNRQSVPGGCSQPRFECRF